MSKQTYCVEIANVLGRISFSLHFVSIHQLFFFLLSGTVVKIVKKLPGMRIITSKNCCSQDVGKRIVGSRRSIRSFWQSSIGRTLRFHFPTCSRWILLLSSLFSRLFDCLCSIPTRVLARRSSFVGIGCERFGDSHWSWMHSLLVYQHRVVLSRWNHTRVSGHDGYPG